MSAFAHAAFSGRCLPGAQARGQSLVPKAFNSRRNGKHSGEIARPTTQLAAIQVLDPEETVSSGRISDADLDFEDSGPPGLSTQQVQSLLSIICNETELAEVELKIGNFDLKMRRSAGAEAMTSANSQMPAYPQFVGSPFMSTASMDQGDFNLQPAQETAPPAGASTDEEDEDESTVYIESHKVGIMRRGRYVKGKKVGKGPIADVGTKVKKGQVVAFVEQLGTFVPIEAQQPGEIVSFVCEEGSSVEYKQQLIELAPFFGGHIIGDKKHA
ncbi:hypothetical protein WJX73_010654 [Symbiochloris irregularis]|uniref:Lipoyl-binding domain-containing protein n=1 Tax=Symbiochloris irregularis TaxID=706552 RepID=A0AAW1PQQ7_9CHLO